MDGMVASWYLLGIGLFWLFIFGLCRPSKNVPKWYNWVHLGVAVVFLLPILLRLFLSALLNW